VKIQYSQWIQRNIERFGFKEGFDYVTVKNDYIVSIDMAKELCIIANNYLSRRYREYHFELDSAFKEATYEELMATAIAMTKARVVAMGTSKEAE
jgi:anti-repressor protein